jgi:hypothetical protein
MGNTSQCLPHPKLLFGKNLGDAIDRSTGATTIAAALDDFIAVELRRPIGNHLVGRFACFKPFLLRAVLIVSRQIRLAHDVCETLEHLSLVQAITKSNCAAGR